MDYNTIIDSNLPIDTNVVKETLFSNISPISSGDIWNFFGSLFNGLTIVEISFILTLVYLFFLANKSDKFITLVKIGCIIGIVSVLLGIINI